MLKADFGSLFLFSDVEGAVDDVFDAASCCCLLAAPSFRNGLFGNLLAAGSLGVDTGAGAGEVVGSVLSAEVAALLGAADRDDPREDLALLRSTAVFETRGSEAAEGGCGVLGVAGGVGV